MKVVQSSVAQQKSRELVVPTRRRIVVVYDRSSASPAEIAKGLSQLADVVFAVNPSPYTERLLPLLGEFGEVLVMDDNVHTATGQVARLRPDGLVTFSERMLRRSAVLAAELGLTFHTPDVVELLTDKYLQRERLRRCGVDSVPSTLLTSVHDWWAAVEDVGLPAVLKPVTGEGSRSTYRVTEAAAGAARLEEALSVAGTSGEPRFVVERFLTGSERHPYGDYVSVESVVSHGAISHVAITGKLPISRPFRETGQFWPARLSVEDANGVLALATGAVRALEVDTGITHTEIKLTDDGPHVIEVNGRLGGHINDLSVRAAGLDLVTVAGRLALGERFALDLVHPEEVVFQLNNLSPTRGFRLDAADGAGTVRAMSHVVRYRAVLRPGVELGPDVSTRELDRLYGAAPSHEEMLRTREQMLDALAFTFTIRSEQIRLTARSLLKTEPKDALR
jgi:biotin carboxylase